MFVQVSVISALVVLCAFVAILPPGAKRQPAKQNHARLEASRQGERHHAANVADAWADGRAGSIAGFDRDLSFATFD